MKYVTKLDLTTRFPSFFPTFWYQFRLLLCYHMTSDTQWSCDNPPLSLWCHYQHTHHVTHTLLLFPLHDTLFNGLFRPYFYSPTPQPTLRFSTQTISLYSHSITSLYDQLLLVIPYSHSTTFSLLLPYIPLSQHSHSTASLHDQLLLVTLHSHPLITHLLAHT